MSTRMAVHLTRLFRGPQSAPVLLQVQRWCSGSVDALGSSSYKLVIVGGGAGGSAIANKFVKKLGTQNVAVIEPSEDHYYQPIWTLVGAGIKDLSSSRRRTEDILPVQCNWIKEKAVKFDPDKNTVTTDGGKVLEYEYLVVAMGVQLNYHTIKGLPEAFETDPAVVSNYHVKYLQKTFPALKAVTEGNAVFSFPDAPIKCPGAPQKIMYLAEEMFRDRGLRDKVNVIYNTSLPRIFPVPKYAEALEKIVEARNIELHLRSNLIEVKPDTREAVFAKLDHPGETRTFKYSFLHVAPPCSAPDVLVNSPLVDETGFLDLNISTLHHNRYKNVFGIGDCTNCPTPRTAAAVAAQSGILSRTMDAVMSGKASNQEYDGYTSCPLVTGKTRCIMAEFGYDFKILETFPIDQGKERRIMYQMKANFLPTLYWKMLTKGRWHGPKFFRKLFSLGTK